MGQSGNRVPILGIEAVSAVAALEVIPPVLGKLPNDSQGDLPIGQKAAHRWSRNPEQSRPDPSIVVGVD